ncbi:hypothetical protein Acr_24g0003630 [Actinidia rufa]|uniref:Uncharacterized protein n=1 Tax=Actinidia rufa TaxID=165716 RepID=A0A7J0GTQ3_9ERIC|nr:hypothetical protein Acr_24g0003630 [Actinidia rufa]
MGWAGCGGPTSGGFGSRYPGPEVEAQCPAHEAEARPVGQEAHLGLAARGLVSLEGLGRVVRGLVGLESLGLGSVQVRVEVDQQYGEHSYPVVPPVGFLVGHVWLTGLK